MALIVMKFGGSSVADRDRVLNAARIAVEYSRDGNGVVVIVSAQGDTTDELIEKAGEITVRPPKR
ncbi:MAG: aspartate kinase, partial [Oscillospiraceae bacterium]